jgi:hypothetical protein
VRRARDAAVHAYRLTHHNQAVTVRDPRPAFYDQIFGDFKPDPAMVPPGTEPVAKLGIDYGHVSSVYNRELFSTFR